jgi:hypothetical protein
MPKEIRVASDAILLTKEYVHRLAKKLKGMRISRQRTTDWLLAIIYAWEGRILDGNGNNLAVPEDVIDRLYGNDLSCSWNSAVKRFAQNPPKRKPKRTLLLRLQFFDAAFKISGQPIEI